MSLVEKARASWLRQMDEIAHEIEGEMKAQAVGKRAHVRTGMASASIKTEKVSDVTYRIGAYASFPPNGADGGTHLYYMTQGNSGNGADGRIHPTRSKGLKLKDGSVRKSVGTYAGHNFIAEIAAKYR